MKISYNTESSRRQERRDRLQLLAAVLGITVGFTETLNIYKGIAFVIPCLGFFVALVNLIIAGLYRKIRNRFGDNLELILTKINGFVMLITGLGFQIEGSGEIQYVYYALALVFFVLFPYFLLPAKKKKLIINLTDSQIIINRLLFKPVIHSWQDVEFISLKKELLQLKTKGGKKSKKYYLLTDDSQSRSEIADLINEIKRDSDYTFESKEE